MVLYLLGLLGAYVAYLIGKTACIRYPHTSTIFWSGVLAVGSGMITNIIALLIYGSILDLHGYRPLNLSLVFGQFFTWSLLGTFAGIKQGRSHIKTGKSQGFEAIFNIPGQGIFKIVVAIIIGCLMLAIILTPKQKTSKTSEVHPFAIKSTS